MSNIAVIYKSKYGSTERYARWIAEDAGADFLSLEEIPPDALQKYDRIVYCGGVYAGRVIGLSKIKSALESPALRKGICVAVCATAPTDHYTQKMKEENLPAGMRDRVDFFLLRGGLDLGRMKFFDRTVISLMIKSIKGKKEGDRTDDDRKMLAAEHEPVDFTDRGAIAPIVALLKG